MYLALENDHGHGIDKVTVNSVINHSISNIICVISTTPATEAGEDEKLRQRVGTVGERRR